MSNQIDRQVKGGRNAFFEDADADRLLAMMMRFMKHHWALYERVRVLESLLEEKGVLLPDGVESFESDSEKDAELDQPLTSIPACSVTSWNVPFPWFR